MGFIINKQPHGRHVTTQRPIVVSARVVSSATAAYVHFRCKLFIDSDDNNNWIDTGVEFNAYSNSSNGIYEANVAEYCRQYITEDKQWFLDNFCNNNAHMYRRRFYVQFNPVFLTTANTLEIVYDQPKNTNTFYAYPLNTTTTDVLSTNDDYVRIDFFVNNGNNGSGLTWPSSAYNLPQTNRPDGLCVNVDQGFHWYNFPILNQPVKTRIGRTKVVALKDDTAIGTFIVYNYDFQSHHGTIPIHQHPYMLEFWYALQNSGNPTGVLYDASGNLMADEIILQNDLVDITTLAFVRGLPHIRYRLCNTADCGGKNTETFIFRNMRGAFDSFMATGTKKKSVEVRGTTFDRHTQFNRNVSDKFDVLRGQHSTTNLWIDRNDTFSVFSQPVTTKEAIWLEELVSSPQVWVVRDIAKYGITNPVQQSGLQAIIIDKSSFNIYSTEDNVHYLEFKYALSENVQTMKM